MTKEQLVKFLVDNFKDEQGYVDLTGLNFRGEDIKGVLISKMKVNGDLWQDEQEVSGNLRQYMHKVQGSLNQGGQEVGGDLWQNFQKVGGNLIQNRHKVKGDLYD